MTILRMQSNHYNKWRSILIDSNDITYQIPSDICEFVWDENWDTLYSKFKSGIFLFATQEMKLLVTTYTNLSM